MMTDKDRDMFFEVLMALSGNGKKDTKEDISHEISHENKETQKNKGV